MFIFASADWMTRNTIRRVEVGAPIYDMGYQVKNPLDVPNHDAGQCQGKNPAAGRLL